MEEKDLEYPRRVRAGYLEMIAREPERWVRVDARQSTVEVQAAIRRCLEERQVLKRDGGTA